MGKAIFKSDSGYFLVNLAIDYAKNENTTLILIDIQKKSFLTEAFEVVFNAELLHFNIDSFGTSAVFNNFKAN